MFCLVDWLSGDLQLREEIREIVGEIVLLVVFHFHPPPLSSSREHIYTARGESVEKRLIFPREEEHLSNKIEILSFPWLK